MTMLHLAVIFLFSALSRALVQCSSHRARVVLSWTDYLRRVAPTGVCLGEDPSGPAGNERKASWLETSLGPSFPAPTCFLSSVCPPHPDPCLLHTPHLPTPPHTPRKDPVQQWPCSSLTLEPDTEPSAEAWRWW